MVPLSSSEILYSIQYLRFVAAAMVVIFHATFNQVIHLGGSVLPVWSAGSAGVDLFFVISGFVMVLVTDGRPSRPGRFLALRVARVAPPYWIVTGVLILTHAVTPGLIQGAGLTPWHTVASFLFLPWENELGNVHPVLVLGWTLNMEMWFYLIFALSLIFTRSTLIGFGIILGLVMTGLAWGPTNPILMVWTSSLLLEFVLGMTIAQIYLRGFSIPIPLAAIFVVVGLGILFQTNFPENIYDSNRWTMAGLPAALVVFGCVMMERSGTVPKIKILRFLGDISYSLYISHYFVLGVLRVIWPKYLIGTLAGEAAFLVTSLAIATLSAAAFHVLVERPLIRQSRKLIAVLP
jgi:exopolysaccharide production protein ExoZ